MRVCCTAFILVGGILAWSPSQARAGDPSVAEGDLHFRLGPVEPTVDLRNMVREHIVRRCRALFEAGAERRRRAFASGSWKAWRDGARRAALQQMGPMPFGKQGGPLNVRKVSRHRRKGHVIENVLFESLPGWDVNASVYLPDAQVYPPPWPAVVVPVGHSGKQFENYQIPAQVFARCGYVAVSFDPPGMAGEKRAGNDHFSDGVRCYLTGHSSNRYFVIDALRCIDYLATRSDVDMARGVGMTGVSGGGTTTMFAALFDDRITAAGPACCALPNVYHPVLDCYAPCAETLAAGRFEAGLDDVDVLIAALPTPMLLMAGAKDEVFKIAWSKRIAASVREAYAEASQAERFRFFVDPGGHAYTVAMALEFVGWMDRWVRKTPDRKVPELTRDDFEMAPRDMLRCKPRQEGNIRSMNRAMAEGLRGNRSGLAIDEAVRRVCHVDGEAPAPKVRRGAKQLIWFHDLHELMLCPEPGIELPATLIAPARAGWKGGAVLYFDDRGRWVDLARNGMLAAMAGFLKEGTDGPAVMTVDLRGWGDTTPAYMPYEIAGWGDRSRWLSYVSAAMGDHVLAMRVRDGLSALASLRGRPEIDPNKVVVGGRGMGGVVALHVAAADGRVAGVFCAGGLARFESLATADSYAWSHEDFLPNVLLHYDLPELVAGLGMPTLLVNPLDAAKRPLSQEQATRHYAQAVERGEAFRLHAGADEGRLRSLLIGFAQRTTR